MVKKLIGIKMIIIIVALVLAASFIYFNKFNDKVNITVITSEAAAPFIDGVEGLEKDSDLIVRVTATDKTESHVELDNEGLLKSFWTDTTVDVEKVYKDNSDIKEGTNIIIYEPTATYEDKNKNKFQVITESYNNMIPKKEYLLFLKKHKDGGYFPLGGFQGKINMDESETSSNVKLEKIARSKYNK